MNGIIKELVSQAGFVGYGEDSGFYNIPAPAFNTRMEMFAQLVVEEILSRIKDRRFELPDFIISAVKHEFGMHP